MVTFNVVKEKHGWSVRVQECMMTPFWSKDSALTEANCLADAIRFHGECAEVIVECADANEAPNKINQSGSARWDALL
jgi:hypothetical protein